MRTAIAIALLTILSYGWAQENDQDHQEISTSLTEVEAEILAKLTEELESFKRRLNSIDAVGPGPYMEKWALFQESKSKHSHPENVNVLEKLTRRALDASSPDWKLLADVFELAELGVSSSELVSHARDTLRIIRERSPVPDDDMQLLTAGFNAQKMLSMEQSESVKETLLAMTSKKYWGLKEGSGGRAVSNGYGTHYFRIGALAAIRSMPLQDALECLEEIQNSPPTESVIRVDGIRTVDEDIKQIIASDYAAFGQIATSLERQEKVEN